MKSLAIFAAAAVMAVIAAPVQAASCTVEATLDVGGVVYSHLNEIDGFEYYYVESNGEAGLQVGAASPVFGWSEPGFDGCENGDTLVY